MALRPIQSWNGFGANTALELDLNPHSACVTHRGAKRLVEMAKEAGLEH